MVVSGGVRCHVVSGVRCQVLIVSCQLSDLPRLGKTWQELGRLGKTWLDLTRLG